MTDRRIRIILDKTQAEKGAKDLDQAVTGVGRAADGAQFAINKLAAAIGAIVSAQQIISFFTESIKASTAFQKSISELSSITGATGEDLKFLSDTARELGASTTLSASQSAAAIKLIASAKPDLLENADALRQVTKEAITLAEAAGVDLATAANTLGTSLNQFNESADESARYINVLAAGAKFGSSEISETAEALKNAGVAAKASNVSFEQANAAIQVLASNGIKAAEGGTALRNVLSILDTNVDKNLRPSVVGLSQALENLNKKNLDATEFTKIFGRENTNAARILSGNVALYDDLTEKLTGTATAYEQAATNTNNLAGDTLRLKSAYEELQISVGEMFGGSLRDGAQDLAAGITSLSENLDTVLRIVELVSVAVGTRMAVAVGAAAVAMAQKAAATTAATRTVSLYTGAVTTTTRATNIMTAAVTASSRAIALMGGPAGILLVAATTFATYISQTKDAETESKKLADTTDILTASIEGLSVAQAKASRVDVLKAIDEQSASFLRLRDAAESMERTLDMHGSENMLGVTEERLIKVRGEMDTTGQSIQKLYDRLQSLDDVIAGASAPQNIVPTASVPKEVDDFGAAGEDPFDKTAFDRQAEALSMGTQQLQRELETRRSISQLYRDADIQSMQNQFAQQRELAAIAEQERLLLEEEKYLTDQEMRVARFEEMLERETLEAEQVAELRRLFEEQEAARLAAFEEQKTAIAEEGATARAKIDRDEKMARIGTWESMANSGLQILGAFASNSFKATKILGIAESGVSIVSGVAKALNNPYPANLGFAAQVAAQGAALISKLKSTNLGGGGGSPQISASAPPQTQQTQTPPENLRPQEQNRAVVDLRGVSEDQWYKGDKIVGLVKELNKYMGDGNAVIRTEDR